MTSGDGIWHPVGLSAAIEPGTANGTRLLGSEIVVWRDTDGLVHVWEDRCPHRGMRLSLGFVRGDQIACLYHGWRYDAGGRCRFIPAHPQLAPPETIRVPALHAAERLGMIWARSGDAGEEPSPDRPVTAVRSIAVECAPEEAVSHLGGSDLGRSPSPLQASAAIPAHPPGLAFATAGLHALAIGVQPLSATECILHVVLAEHGDDDATARKRASAWAEMVRSALERPRRGMAAGP